MYSAVVRIWALQAKMCVIVDSKLKITLSLKNIKLTKYYSFQQLGQISTFLFVLFEKGKCPPSKFWVPEET